MKPSLACLATGLAVAIAVTGALPASSRSERESDATVSVHVTTIVPMRLDRRLSLYGEIIPEPASPGRPAARASLSSVTGGQVTSVLVVEGQAIEQGAIALQLDSRQADAAIERARAVWEQASTEAERETRLAEHDDASARQREVAERQLAEAGADLAVAQASRDYLDLRAPLSGTVLAVHVRPSDVVNATDELVEIVDLERLVAQVRAPSFTLSALRVGQDAVIETAVGEAAGHVVYVGPGIDPANGTAAVRIAIASPRGLHPGEFVRAHIVVESRPDALAVPVSAVVHGADGSGSVSVIEDGRAHLRPVALGIEDGDWVEVEGAGIRPGTRVVTEEAYGLPDDTPVRVVQESASR